MRLELAGAWPSTTHLDPRAHVLNCQLPVIRLPDCSLIHYDPLLWKTEQLVGGLEHVFFHSVGKFIIPTDFHSMIFQRGRLKPPTRLLTIINHH